MISVFVQPFQQSRPAARKMLAMSMVLLTLMACNYQLIPFIFYRPKFYCEAPLGLVQCNQFDACVESTLKYQSEYTFSSIPQQFKLYCSDKKDEATILTFMMLGHLMGSFLGVYISDYGHKQFNVVVVLMVSSLASGLSCILASVSSSITVVGFALTMWSFGSQMIVNFLFMSPMLFFPHSMVKRVFSLIVMSWITYPAILPTMIRLNLSWRITLFLNVGLPHIIWTIYAWYNLKELTNIDTSEMELTQPITQSLTPLSVKKLEIDEFEVLEMTSACDNEMRVSYRDIYNSPHLRNILLYLVVYAGSCVAGVTSILTLGSINGNIYYIITIINLIELTISYCGSHLARHFSVHALLNIIYLLIAITYALYTFVPTVFRFLIVIEGKLLTDITWIFLNNLTVLVSPPKYIPLIIATRSIYNIVVSAMLPYIKYFMEVVRLNLFIFAAIYETIAWVCVRSIHEMDTSKD